MPVLLAAVVVADQQGVLVAGALAGFAALVEPLLQVPVLPVTCIIRHALLQALQDEARAQQELGWTGIPQSRKTH